jgi:8-oxo-dGTP pyrophosphatase MutT (NUDIX family)
MYKVFVDNKAKTYQLDSEKELLDEFKDYDLIEAAGGLVQKNNKYLFIKRNGIWDIPKGKLEEGEDVEAAAIREIEEECGLDQPIIERHLINTWHTYPLKGRKILKKTYWYLLTAKEDNKELIPQLEEGITEVKYLSLDNLEEVKANTFTSILEVIDTIVN